MLQAWENEKWNFWMDEWVRGSSAEGEKWGGSSFCDFASKSTIAKPPYYANYSWLIQALGSKAKLQD
jgi:hypothetical protein